MEQEVSLSRGPGANMYRITADFPGSVHIVYESLNNEEIAVLLALKQTLLQNAEDPGYLRAAIMLDKIILKLQ